MPTCVKGCRSPESINDKPRVPIIEYMDHKNIDHIELNLSYCASVFAKVMNQDVDDATDMVTDEDWSMSSS